MVRNRNTEKGYRDVPINVNGSLEVNTNIIAVKCNLLSPTLVKLVFPVEISQSTIGGRWGSNAGTVIAVVFGAICVQQSLYVSLLWQQLPQTLVECVTNAICEGNRLYDDLYGDTSIYLYVDDVVNSFGNDCNIQSRDQVFYFSNVNGYSSLKDYVQSTSANKYGVLVGCGKSVGIHTIKNGPCALFDSHRSSVSSGAIVTVAGNLQTHWWLWCKADRSVTYTQPGKIYKDRILLGIHTYTDELDPQK